MKSFAVLLAAAALVAGNPAPAHDHDDHVHGEQMPLG